MAPTVAVKLAKQAPARRGPDEVMARPTQSGVRCRCAVVPSTTVGSFVSGVWI